MSASGSSSSGSSSRDGVKSADESVPRRRVAVLTQHLVQRHDTAASSTKKKKAKKAKKSKKAKKGKKKQTKIVSASLVAVGEEAKAYPLPPMSSWKADMENGKFFPQFEQMKADNEKLGGIFSYVYAGGRRMTVFADPALHKLIFFPDHDNVRHNASTLAYHWFGIRKDVSKAHTDDGLKATRLALKPSKVRGMNNGIAADLLRLFDSWEKPPSSSSSSSLSSSAAAAGVSLPLFEVAEATFWPVNKAMFGAEVVSPSVCPGLLADYHEYNSCFEKVANG